MIIVWSFLLMEYERAYHSIVNVEHLALPMYVSAMREGQIQVNVVPLKYIPGSSIKVDHIEVLRSLCCTCPYS